MKANVVPWIYGDSLVLFLYFLCHCKTYVTNIVSYLSDRVFAVIFISLF